jgi:hypothetical protein
MINGAYAEMVLAWTCLAIVIVLAVAVLIDAIRR